MGHLHAKVGFDNAGLERVMGRHGLGTKNCNGNCLVDFCNENEITVAGTLFPHKIHHNVTWVSLDDRI